MTITLQNRIGPERAPAASGATFEVRSPSGGELFLRNSPRPPNKNTAAAVEETISCMRNLLFDGRGMREG